MTYVDKYRLEYKDFSESELIFIIQRFSPNTDEYIAAKQLLHEKEVERRLNLAKPHWSLPWTFWISLAILIVAILAWLFPHEKQQTPNDKPAISKTSSAPTPINLPPAKGATQQTSPPAPALIQGTNLPVK
jgi:hypothetical protein